MGGIAFVFVVIDNTMNEHIKMPTARSKENNQG